MTANTTRRKRRAPASVEAAEPSHQPDDLTLPATGDLPERDSVIERVSDMSTVDEKAKVLAFMEEPVEIMIHESMDANPEPFVFCAVNGEGAGPNKVPWLPRGRTITVKRKFVERLARARRVNVRTDETRDGRGDRTTVVRRNSSMAYPFQVQRDPNPEGPAWLKRVLAEA